MNEYRAHLWIGRFGPSAPEEYFVQQRNDDDEDAPLSPFAGDMGEIFIDYDFAEISYIEEFQDVREFIDGHSYSDQYIDEVVAKAKDLGVAQINVFVMVAKDQIATARTATGNDFNLWYLGEFVCKY